jgi:SAM-dependent methyltransferase
MNQQERFYSVFSKTEVRLPSPNTKRNFEEGMRYAICNQSLALDPLIDRNIIVELGCGNGEKLLYLQHKYDFDQAIGIDLGFTTEYRRDRSIFYSANLNDPWPIDDGSADVLIAMMLLEHLFDPFASFREINRVLSAQGRAFVNLPLISSYKNRSRLLVGRLPTTSVPYARWEAEGHWDGFHLHYFTINSILNLASHAGLHVNSFKSVGKWSRIKSLFPSLLCDEISFEMRKAKPS